MGDSSPLNASTTRPKVHRRAPSLPWDHAKGDTRRPSAYTYYKKLVHDFDSLEDDLEQSRLEQEQLEAHLRHHKEAVEAHAKLQREQELAAWERERERRVEAICVHNSAVEDLRKQQATLEEEEIRLQAELEVLHEKQQQANETDAKRVYDLVHVRTTLLEKELEKGRMDIEFLTQVVSNAKRKPEPSDDVVHAVVNTIRERRQDAFREATAEFQQRLHSFELEKEALRRKTEEIQWKKQRALQILSNNQQQVIADFFTTPRAAIQDANPPLPSLEFAAILDAMKQPTGDAVSHLRNVEHGKETARRRLADALAEAERNLEDGPKKLEAIQKSMLERQQDALRLNIPLSSRVPVGQSSNAAYDGVWGVETYRQDQYGLVYFIRSLVFEWMERAVQTSNRQPATQLLELEIRRHKATHAVLHTLEQQARLTRCGLVITNEIEDEVYREMAGSIHEELLHSADRVRDLIERQMKAAMFPQASQHQNRRASTSKSTGDSPSAPGLRWSLFGPAWEEIKRQREPDLAPTRRLTRLVMRPAEPLGMAARSPVASTTSTPGSRKATSPVKKRFAFFGGGPTSEATNINTLPSANAAQLQHEYSRHIDHERLLRDVLVSEVSRVDATAQDDSLRDVKQTERALWEQLVAISDYSLFTSLSSCGLVSCLQLSSDGRYLAVGTLDGEVIVYSMGDDEASSPTAVRVTRADKAAASSKSIGVARVTRLHFSPCTRWLISYNQPKIATLWAISLPAQGLLPTSHSSDCFSTEVQELKPPSLVKVHAVAPLELFQEPPTPADVLERDAPVAAARLQAAPALTVSAFDFFPSLSLIGESTHLLVGISNGDIAKVPARVEQTQKTQAPQWLLGQLSEAAFDVPRSMDPDLRQYPPTLRPSSSCCEREFFRAAHHQRSVLFVSVIASLTDSVSAHSETRLVSVDQDARVALWTYSRKQFCGFGWFVPRCLYQLDLTTRDDASATGTILQIQLTRDKKTLVLMVFFATTSTPRNGKNGTANAATGQLRFIQLDLSSNDLCVRQTRLELDMVGAIPPRFTLISIRQPAKAIRRPHSVAPKSARGLSPSRSSFLVLLMDNALHVFSLQTGDRCREIPLGPLKTDPKARPTRKEPSLLFNSIAACSRLEAGGPGRAIVVVAGEQHRQIRRYRFNISSS